MSSLDIKRLELDLAKCYAAKLELEYKIEERRADIKRMEDHIQLQRDREQELTQRLEDLKKQ